MIYTGTQAYVIWARSYSGGGSFSIVVGAASTSGNTNAVGTSARIGQVNGISGDSIGNIYFTDYDSNQIKKIVQSSLTVSLVAGAYQGCCGSGGDGTNTLTALFNVPFGIWVSTNGNMFITEYTGFKVRYVFKCRI